MASFSVNISRQIAPSNIERVNECFRNRLPSTIIWGLVLSHSIVEYSTVCILMLYLTNVLGKGLLVAAIIINVLDGLSAVFAFLVAYIGDHFNVIIFSTGSYTMGLILLWITAWSLAEFSMFYLAVVLIALGKSGRSSTIQCFLGYQLRDRNNLENANAGNREDQQRQRDVGTKIWWHSAWISGYVIVLFAHDYDSGLKNFKISALLMGATSLVFYLGFMLYDYQKPARMSLGSIFMVLMPAELNKLLLWATFIPYSLVLATGNTLFIAQINNLDTHIGNNFRVPYSFLFVLKSYTSDLVVFLFWYWSRSTRTRHTGTVTLVRIGAGMVCAVFCCVAARQVEILRQHSIRDEGILENPNKISSQSVLLLTPQYCLLGLMEGLAGGGLFTYILGHLPGLKRSFAEPFSELVLCVGKFISIPFMLIFSFWFDQNINISQMDRYFLMLAIVSCVFFGLYLCWALNYGDLETNLEIDESETIVTAVENGQPVQQESHADQGDEENQNDILETFLEETSNIQDGNEEILEEGETEASTFTMSATNVLSSFLF